MTDLKIPAQVAAAFMAREAAMMVGDVVNSDDGGAGRGVYRDSGLRSVATVRAYCDEIEAYFNTIKDPT